MSRNPKIARAREICLGLALAGAFQICPIQAATLVITPTSAPSDYLGEVTLAIAGLDAGQTILVRKYLDLDADGVVGAQEPLVQSFEVTDGATSSIAGVRVGAVPGDEDGEANGQVESVVHFQLQSEINRGVAHFVYEVSAAGMEFTPVSAPFTVTSLTHAQAVRGQVTSGGSPVAHAYVFLLVGGRGGPGIAALSDTDGQFSLPCPVGEYTLGVLCPGFLFDFMAAPTVTVAGGATVDQDLALLPSDRTIAGAVIEGDTGGVISGAQIMLVSQSQLMTLVTTDAEGHFTASVSSGSDYWGVETNEQDAALHGCVDQNHPTVDTSQGDVTDVEVRLPRATALIFGELRDGASIPVPGIRLWADSQNFEAGSTTRSDGSYEICVVAGQWYMEPDAVALAQLGYTVVEPQVTLATGQAIRVDLTASRATSYLRGHARDSLGNPLNGISMRASGEQGAEAATTTDADGFFELGVTGGRWNLHMSSGEAQERGLVRSYLWLDVVDGIDYSNINYVAPHRTAQIICSVRDTRGNPVGGIGVGSEATILSVSYGTWADTDSPGGEARLNAINGTWSVYPSSSDLANQGYELAPGQSPVQSVLVAGSDATVLFLVQADSFHIVPTPLPDAKLGVSYAQSLSASGGQAPYSWSLAPGSSPLPPGIELWSTGTLFGTPSAAGPYTFTVRATDVLLRVAEITFSITVSTLPLEVVTSALPDATLGVFYVQTLTASGGQPGYAWSLAPGSSPLPPGIGLNSSGTFSGTPTAAGPFDLVVRVTDAFSNHADKEFVLTVIGGGRQPTLGNLEMPADGRFRFRIESGPGPSCQVWGSTDLNEWTLLGPAIPEGNGTWTYTDSDAAHHPGMRFYKVVTQ